MKPRRALSTDLQRESPSRAALAAWHRWNRQEEDRARVAAEADAAPPCVIVAEDDADMRELIAWRLRQDGCEVIEVADGTELLAVLESLRDDRLDFGPVDLVISDVRMPGHSGMEALEALRRVDPATPVLLITAFGDAELHAEACRLGADVFDKPFDLDDLRTVVRNVSHLTGRLRRRARSGTFERTP